MAKTRITVEKFGGDKIIHHVVSGGTAEDRQGDIDQIIKRAFRGGHTVIYPDGTRVFRERVPRCKKGKYEWSDDGNRVRADIIEYTSYPDATEDDDQRVVRSVWVKW
jgi:hypothetical protein